MLALEIQGPKRSTLFVKLRDLYPECFHLIGDEPKLFPMRCYVDHCPRNARCQDKLVQRTKFMFDAFPRADLLQLYFSYRDRPGSQRAALFWRDMREPRYITFNRTSWEKMKEVGVVFEYHLPDSLFLPTRQAG